MEQRLAWSTDKKLALQGHLLLNERFLRGLGSSVAPEWFGSESALVRVRSLQVRFLEHYGRPPTPQELPECVFLHGAKDDERREVAAAVDLAVRATERFGLDALQEEVLHWHKDVLFRDAWERAGAEYRRGKDDEARRIIDEMIRKVGGLSLHDDQAHDWTAYRTFFQRVEAEYGDSLTFGHPLLDYAMCPEAHELWEARGKVGPAPGGLLPGMSTVALAATNVGKSRFAGTVVRHNALRGEPVLYVVHEDREQDSAFNIWTSTLGITRGEYLRLLADPTAADYLDEVAALLRRNVDYLYLPKAGLTVEEVVATVRRRNDERRAKNGGRGYRLFVDDYPQKLTAKQVHGDLRHIQAYVYQQLFAVTRELGFHSLFLIQANRAGNVMARGREATGGRGQVSRPRWLSSGDMKEVFDPACDCDNMLSINRPPEFEKSDTVVYFFEKLKGSMYRGWSAACESRFGWALAHAPEMRATLFRSEWAEAEDVRGWLRDYDGKAVPDHLLQAGGRP